MPRIKIYQPHQNEKLVLSRTQISNFKECPRCFFIKQRYGINPPGSPPFLLNTAVDNLLKNEFEIYRNKQEPHPIFIENNLNFIPKQFEDEKWRNIKYFDEKRNIEITGILDDIWDHKDTNEIVLADYKATSTPKDINLYIGFRWQMDIYAYVLKQKGFKVHSKAYFLYANADRYKDKFASTLHFNMFLKEYTINDTWIGETLDTIRSVLDSPNPPKNYEECKNCNYVNNVNDKLDKI